MNSKRSLALFFAVFAVLSLRIESSTILDAKLWLTRRIVRIACSPTDPLHFSDSGDRLPVIDVNDMQQFQTSRASVFALTGGSAQLLMHMTPARRAALLKELFTSDGERHRRELPESEYRVFRYE